MPKKTTSGTITVFESHFTKNGVNAPGLRVTLEMVDNEARKWYKSRNFYGPGAQEMWDRWTQESEQDIIDEVLKKEIDPVVPTDPSKSSNPKDLPKPK